MHMGRQCKSQRQKQKLQLNRRVTQVHVLANTLPHAKGLPGNSQKFPLVGILLRTVSNSCGDLPAPNAQCQKTLRANQGEAGKQKEAPIRAYREI